jgi:hypothetical protein
VVTGLKHQKEKRSMDHFAGLDVSVKETSVCIVDDTGKIVREMLLTHRKLLQSKAIAIENDLRGTLRNFGLKVGVVGTL